MRSPSSAAPRRCCDSASTWGSQGERLDKAEGFFSPYGGAVVTGARFIQELCQANGIVAGTIWMPQVAEDRSRCDTAERLRGLEARADECVDREQEDQRENRHPRPGEGIDPGDNAATAKS
jgi:hypothetical protein